MNLGGEPISEKKDSIGGNTLITCSDRKRTRRWVTWEDLNGPRTKSEEPNHSGRHASRLKGSNPILFSYWNPSKLEPGTSPRDQSPTFQAHSLQNHIVKDLSRASPTTLLGRRGIVSLHIYIYKIIEFEF